MMKSSSNSYVQDHEQIRTFFQITQYICANWVKISFRLNIEESMYRIIKSYNRNDKSIQEEP